MDEKSTTPDKVDTVDNIDDIMDYMDVDGEPTHADGPQSPPDQPVLGTGKNEKGTNMEQEQGTGKSGPDRRTVMIVAAVCAAALAVAGAVGYKAWTNHETALAAQDCQSAASAAGKAKSAYEKLMDGDAATASKTTAGQVQDSKTVDALAKALQESEPKTTVCKADDSKTGYTAASETLAKNKTWYESHTKDLQTAVGKVSESKLAKTIADAEDLYSSSDGRVQDTATRDALRKAIDAKDETAIGKAVTQVNDSIAAKTQADEEEARRKAEEEAAQAQAQAEAEAAAAAQAQQSYSYSQDYQYYSQDNSYSGGSTQSGSSSSAPSTSTGASSSSGSSSSSGPISGGHGVGSANDCDAACQAPIVR